MDKVFATSAEIEIMQHIEKRAEEAKRRKKNEQQGKTFGENVLNFIVKLAVKYLFKIACIIT